MERILLMKYWFLMQNLEIGEKNVIWVERWDALQTLIRVCMTIKPINSLSLAKCMRQRNGSSFVHVMTCRLLRAKPLSESILANGELNP